MDKHTDNLRTMNRTTIIVKKRVLASKTKEGDPTNLFTRCFYLSILSTLDKNVESGKNWEIIMVFGFRCSFFLAAAAGE